MYTLLSTKFFSQYLNAMLNYAGDARDAGGGYTRWWHCVKRAVYLLHFTLRCAPAGLNK